MRCAVEESWVLVGACEDGAWRCRRLRYRSGAVASVTADGAWTLRREESHRDVGGFMHTHPMGGPRPSSRDVRTMRAWCDAFGKSLICVIATPGAVAGWRFDGWGSDGVPLASVELRGKTKVIGVEYGGKVPSRSAVSRRGRGREAGVAARRVVRRRSNRLESGR